MNRRVLIAIDDSTPSKQAVAYAATVGTRVPSLGFTLFHVLPPVPESLLEPAGQTPDRRGEIDRLTQGKRRESGGVLSEYRAVMAEAGVDPGRVDLVAAARSQGVAKAILDFAQEGRYDAILVGRRGRNRIRNLFMGSVTASLAEHSNLLPIWVVDGPVALTSVLAAVDGSESALRAVEHLASILEGAADTEVTLFHATPRYSETCPVDSPGGASHPAAVGQRGSLHCIEGFTGKAQAALASALAGGRLRVETAVTRLGPGKAILELAKSAGHDTIVMGRRGAGRSFFTGSVSRYVLDRSAGHALWLVS